MALRQRIEYLMKEHKELLNLADSIEKMLELASRNDIAGHLKSLKELRALEHGLTGIIEHCHSENRIVESTYHQYLNQVDCARIDAEHEQIIRAVMNFREDLRFATVDRTMAMILPGMDVVNLLRVHVAYERELLTRIAHMGDSPQRILPEGKPSKDANERKRRHITRRKRATKSPTVLPYTLEPHPEL